MPSEPPFGLVTGDGRRPRVAIVCANVANATVTIMLCEQFGCAPYAAQTGEAALALLRKDEIDLVMLDLGLGNKDAMVTAQLIRTLGPRGSMPILALADKGADFAALNGRAGFAGTVVKPYSPRELYGAMQSALARTAATATV